MIIDDNNQIIHVPDNVTLIELANILEKYQGYQTFIYDSGLDRQVEEISE